MLVKGDRVIFCAGRAAGRLSAIYEIIHSLGLIPLVYEGIGTAVRDSSLDGELRDDFYGAQFRVIVLDPGIAGSMEDNWAIPEVGHVPRDQLLIYSTEIMSDQEIKRLNLPVRPVHVKAEAELEKHMREQLEGLLRGN